MIYWLVVSNYFLFSISYMGCHPSHWLTFFREVETTNQDLLCKNGSPYQQSRCWSRWTFIIHLVKSCKSVKRPLPPFLHSISSYPFISYIHDMGMICLDQIWLNECILVLLCLLLQKWTRRWSFWTCYFRSNCAGHGGTWCAIFGCPIFHGARCDLHNAVGRNGGLRW